MSSCLRGWGLSCGLQRYQQYDDERNFVCLCHRQDIAFVWRSFGCWRREFITSLEAKNSGKHASLLPLKMISISSSVVTTVMTIATLDYYFLLYKQKKVLVSCKFSISGFRGIYTFWDVLNTIWLFLENVCLSVCVPVTKILWQV